ncbi:uncharacterized protein [Amphiura filiformis]|uniref:uncharacterized protein n=1 Tax=Amphiura filiformis TaxID=82378 RepID=UPI003B22606A
MEVHQILFMIAMICRVQSIPDGEMDEDPCEAICKNCFANRQDSLKRMGCLEKCIRQDVAQFTCPARQSFLGTVETIPPIIQEEIVDYYVKRSDLFSAKDVEDIAATVTVDSLLIIDNQKPVIGRADRKQQLTDFFTANPEIDRAQFEPVNFGNEHGIIWVNGSLKYYDKNNQQVSLLRFMAILKRINGQFQSSTTVLFQ